MLEEPVEDRVVSPESIGEEEPKTWEDQDEPESEEEQKSSVLFTPEQLEVLLKLNRPDFGKLVATNTLLGPGVNPLEGSLNVKLQKVGIEGTLSTSNSREG
jgi:hypothetical protein